MKSIAHSEKKARDICRMSETPRYMQWKHTDFRKTRRIHIFDRFCSKYNITHKLIRPRTPWHNGKVERSHRNDQERFYNYLKFYSYDDLLTQMRRYLRHANNIPMAVLNWKSPQQLHKEMENSL